jgi:D-tyrosyl-tRNA(Tyr) deacylase
MKAVVQRVSRASVKVGGNVVSSIGQGFAVLLGVAKGDRDDDALDLSKKCAELRVFEDEAGKMNLSLLDIGGEMLVISQFTLCADTKRGRRPSFSEAAPAEEAERLYRVFIDSVKSKGINVMGGVFGAKMDVELVNRGPVTLVLEAQTHEE